MNLETTRGSDPAWAARDTVTQPIKLPHLSHVSVADYVGVAVTPLVRSAYPYLQAFDAITTVHPSTAATLLIDDSTPLSGDQNVGTIIRMAFDERSAFALPGEKNPIDQVVGQLRAFKFLPENWNAYNGVPPSNRAVEDCIHFLKRLMARIPPAPMVSGDGEVGLFWENQDCKVEVGFTGDGHYGYCVMKAANHSSFENEGVEIDTLPDVLAVGLDETAYLSADQHDQRRLPPRR